MDRQIRELGQRAATGDPAALSGLATALRRADIPMTLDIDGETVTVVGEAIDYEGVVTVDVETEDGEARNYCLFRSPEAAGRAARQYWQDMAEGDPDEFTAMVGAETLLSWALGQFAGPGSTQVTSLSEWLDLWLDTPEEHWGAWDSSECEVTDASAHLRDLLGFNPRVAYRAD